MTASESMPTGAQTPAAASPVNTFNEWDPLEEIIVGIVEDALIPPWETITPAVVHDKSQWPFFKAEGGRRWPAELLKKAERDIEAFVHILEAEGVTVRRPERFAWDQPIAALNLITSAMAPALWARAVGEQYPWASRAWREIDTAFLST